MSDLFGDSASPALALARKWRPRVFADLKGQEHAVRALSNALTQGRLHHAYLLTGTRGVGKTTLARILAKCLNCEAGVTATPCGVCSACTQIDAGRFVDLLELDAASNTGVDNMREVLDNAQYAPTVGRYKVYIIDEVHMLSKPAFNSMLKTLEEPPAHVKFILATTDPQKIPVTVLSRCLQFNLKPMPPALVAQHLGEVLAAEKVEAEPAALTLLARAAAGSMRDALSLTDQAIAYGGGAVLASQVDAMLGTVRRDYLFDLLDALAAKDGDALMRQTQALAERGIAFDAALQDFAQLLTQLAVQLHAPAALEETPDAVLMAETAGRLDPETAQLYYQIALAGRRDLPYAPDEYSGFCMTLLRMLAFAPASPGSFVSGTPAGQGGAQAMPHAAWPAPASAAPTVRAQAAAATTTPRARAPEPELARAPACATTAAEPVPASHEAPPWDDVPPWEDEAVAAPLERPRPSPERAALPAEPAEPLRVAEPEPAAAPRRELPAEWDWHAESSRVKGLAKMLADVCELVTSDATGITLRIDAAHKHLLDRMYQDKLVAALRERHGAGLEVRFETGAPATATPQQTRTRVRAERQTEAVEAIESDPFVQALVADFGGRIDPASIQPLGDPS